MTPSQDKRLFRRQDSFPQHTLPAIWGDHRHIAQQNLHRIRTPASSPNTAESTMSSIPKARKSTISDLTVTPDKWDFYPSVERSVLRACNFTNLSSSTYIRHSKLKEVDISSPTAPTSTPTTPNSPSIPTTTNTTASKPSYIEHSTISSTSISASYILKSELHSSTLTSVAHMSRAMANTSTFKSPSHIERSHFHHSQISDRETRVDKSNVRNSSISGGSSVSKSKVTNGSSIHSSSLEKADLDDCDIVDCQIEKTRFKGMVLRNGIWKKGDLVGRVRRDVEVIVEKKEEKATEKGTQPAIETNKDDETGERAERRERWRSKSDYEGQEMGEIHISTPTEATGIDRLECQRHRDPEFISSARSSIYSSPVDIEEGDDGTDEDDNYDFDGSHHRLPASTTATTTTTTNPINDNMITYIRQHNEKELPPPYEP